ncbi:MAG: GDP-mannose 4,6-dehydratase, partial [Caldilinea sp.]|nr:GDP-mannose 4,6-dehydratase [Caldilinea sp.]
AEIELGLHELVVHLGNLCTERDFTDVRDVVRAYWLLAQHGETGACYNVGSGQPRTIRWLLDTLLDLTDIPIDVAIDPARLRPSDVPVSYCDNQRLVAATGWQPEIDLRTSLKDLLDTWRKQVSKQEPNERK